MPSPSGHQGQDRGEGVGQDVEIGGPQVVVLVVIHGVIQGVIRVVMVMRLVMIMTVMVRVRQSEQPGGDQVHHEPQGRHQQGVPVADRHRIDQPAQGLDQHPEGPRPEQ
jgi:hypothetical protein